MLPFNSAFQSNDTSYSSRMTCNNGISGTAGVTGGFVSPVEESSPLPPLLQPIRLIKQYTEIR